MSKRERAPRILIFSDNHWAKKNWQKALLSEGFDAWQTVLLPTRFELSIATREKRIRRDLSSAFDLLNGEWDCVLVLGDANHWSVRTYCHVAHDILKAPVIFGLHNHLCKTSEPLLEGLRRADGLILLSRDSLDYYSSFAPELRCKPVSFIPSLYLPSRRRYRNSTRLKPTSDRDRRPLKIGLGGSWFTSGRGLGAGHRYNFLRVVQLLSREGHEIHLFGHAREISERFAGLSKGGISEKPPRSEKVLADYRLATQNNGSLFFRGFTPQFERELAKMDWFITKGFLPNEENLPTFENMNYQLRYTSSLLAAVPVIVAAGTDAILEKQIREHGFGRIWTDHTDLMKLGDVDEVMAAEVRKSLAKAREINSAEHWSLDFANLVRRVLRSNSENS